MIRGMIPPTEDVMTVRTKLKKYEMLGEFLAELGGISPNRIRMIPLPGKATENKSAVPAPRDVRARRECAVFIAR